MAAPFFWLADDGLAARHWLLVWNDLSSRIRPALKRELECRKTSPPEDAVWEAIFQVVTRRISCQAMDGISRLDYKYPRPG